MILRPRADMVAPGIVEADLMARAIDFGDLRRTEPVTRSFGFDRGLPVDRHYIDSFLRQHVADIRGTVLEVGDDGYTRRFGAGITRSAVLDLPLANNPAATLIGDLGIPDRLPDSIYDCFICTQTLLFVRDPSAAVRSIHRLLRSNGIALVTVPGISQIVRDNMDREGDFWRFTTRSCTDLFATSFGTANVSVTSYGNVLAATAFLYGLAAEDLADHELGVRDPDYQLLIGVRVRKA